MGGFFGQRLKNDGTAGHVIEQRFHLLVEQRQPVLHAGITAALGDGGVEHVVRTGGAERRHIAGAEGADRVARELEFGHRHEIERAQLGTGALRLRIEAADGFQRVAEKIEPHRLAHAGREQVENAAAHCVIAWLAHRRGAIEAVEIEPLHDAGHRQEISGRGGERLPRHDLARRHALQDGVDGGEHHGGLGAGLDAGEPRQRRHALGHHGGVRRHAIVGQAIPGGEFQDFGVRREKRDRAVQHRHARAVAADHGRADGRRLVAGRDGTGEIGYHQAFGAIGDIRQKQRPSGSQALCRVFRFHPTRHRLPSAVSWNAIMSRRTAVS